MNTITKVFFNLKNRHFFLFDAIGFLVLPLAALLIRLDGDVRWEHYGPGLVAVMLVFPLIKLTIFYFSGMYQRYWRYASIDEVAYIGIITAIAVLLQTIFFIIFYHVSFLPFGDIPRSVPVIDGMLSFIFVGGTRFSVRLVERFNELSTQNYRTQRKQSGRTIIIGAGKSGISLVSEIQRSPQHGIIPVAFIDDDRRKRRLRIRGLDVVGDRTQIPNIVRKYKAERAIIAMPTAPGREIREILEICKLCNIRVSTVPSIFEIINGKIRLESVRDVQIEDLLRREPVHTDINKVAAFISRRKVLVTGAGGSIGSEICRQILSFNPEEVVLLGHGENSLFEVEQEMRNAVASLYRNGHGKDSIPPKIRSYIADIRSISRMKILFDSFVPDIIFHAAAHKHVPMMEVNPTEAISNNVIGTKNLLYLATRYGVENFVNISTDKAVNPSSVMGASKRIAEILVLQAAQKVKKKYVCVRFGNVLGSRGSVVPIFKQQIAEGGPIQVTHPEIRRYFMTIPESVQLVLQASVIGKGGEIFVLNMGEPIRIVDLAKDLIRLSGIDDGKEIEIEYTGLRPGEKLFEELFVHGEEYAPTEHEKILIACNASQVVTGEFDEKIDRLTSAAERNNLLVMKRMLAELLPEFNPDLGGPAMEKFIMENQITESDGK
jgi:FlaA1/EpsC-like NDP-sugar epimerase